MKFYEFKSDRNWLKAYDALERGRYEFCSYGDKAITCFTDDAALFLRGICAAKKIAYKEVAEG